MTIVVQGPTLTKYLNAKYSIFPDLRRGDRIEGPKGMNSIPDMDDKRSVEAKKIRCV